MCVYVRVCACMLAGVLHIVPVSSVLQMRPTFRHLDVVPGEAGAGASAAADAASPAAGADLPPCTCQSFGVCEGLGVRRCPGGSCRREFFGCYRGVLGSFLCVVPVSCHIAPR